MSTEVSEGEAWRDIAERIDLTGTTTGLCLECLKFDYPFGIMAQRLELFKPDERRAWWWPLNRTYINRDGDFDDRILAACFLAAMADAGEKI